MRRTCLMVLVAALTAVGVFFGPIANDAPAAAGQRVTVNGPCQPAEEALVGFRETGWTAIGGGADFAGDGVTVWLFQRRFLVVMHLVKRALICVIASGPDWEKSIITPSRKGPGA